VYTFSQGKLKAVTNKQFSNIKNNYEISFGVNSDIRPCEDGDDIKVDSYNFVKISSISNIEPNSIVDVLRALTTVSSTSVVYNPPQGLELYRWAVQCGEGGAKSLQTVCLSGGG